VWEGDGISDEVDIRVLKPGLHVITGFGLDTWDVPRCAFIRDELLRGFPPHGRGRLDTEDLKRVLSSHRAGTVDSDVCVHDPGESHLTVSSCVVRATADWSFHVDATPAAPCLGRPWDRFRI
jgi:hypothetical protein